jgi:transketolase
MKKIRQEFADTLLEVGDIDNDFVVMVGDISHGILQPFAKKFPGRYYNIGICEPTIVNMAAGLSKLNIIPVVHTIAPFITERAYEQIKLDFGYQNLPINIVSVGGAFDYAQLGCSHHCYTDVSLICHFKRGTVVIPGSCIEFNILFKESYKNGLINYYRIPEYPHGIEIPVEKIQFGKGVLISEGSDVTIVTTGTQLKNAVEAAEVLKKDGISVEVLYYHTIKPFDGELLRKSLTKTKHLVCVEELSAHDGLFNMCLRNSYELNGIKYKQMAIEDFVLGYGTYEELCEKIGLSSKNIKRQIVNLLEK